MDNELINKVESLKNLLVSRATGGEGHDMQYKTLRRDLLAVPKIAGNLPQVVHVCRDMSEFWGFIKSKFATYSERREYLRSEFDTLLMKLEGENGAPSDSEISATIGIFQASCRPSFS